MTARFSKAAAVDLAGLDMQWKDENVFIQTQGLKPQKTLKSKTGGQQETSWTDFWRS